MAAVVVLITRGQQSFASVTPLDDHGAAVAAVNGGGSSTMSSTSSVAPGPTQTVSGGNLQTFSGALGGVLTPVVMPPASNTFEVGSNSMNDQRSALVRSW
jgi:hypothetical protein